jgi:Cu+-exporting ATPase
MFFIEVIPNPAVSNALLDLKDNGIALSVRTRDSLVTKQKIVEIFDLDPEKVKILPFDLHSKFEHFSKYTSRGSSEIACNGTFTSFARALVCAKMLIRDMTVSSASLFASVFLAAVLCVIFMLFVVPNMLNPSGIIIYNTVWTAVMLGLQWLRRY